MDTKPNVSTERAGWASRVLHWPLVRLVLACAMVIGAQVGGQVLLGPSPAAATLSMRFGRSVALLLVAHIAYQLYVWALERRRASELSLDGAPGEAGRGAVIGAGLMTAAVGVLWAAGFYHVVGRGPVMPVVATVAALVTAAYLEELIFRLIFFRLVEEATGTTVAIGLSALLFGALHAFNPNATPVSILSIATAGALLAAAFLVSRRMWLPLGLHFAWNFFQGSVYGVPISGGSFPGLLVGRLTGPPMLSGGPFGVEGSLLSVLVCAAATVPLLRIAVRRGHWVAPPAWLRRSAPPAAPSPQQAPPQPPPATQ
jgi:membrane protease YdiL (CAAX protease family)